MRFCCLSISEANLPFRLKKVTNLEPFLSLLLLNQNLKKINVNKLTRNFLRWVLNSNSHRNHQLDHFRVAPHLVRREVPSLAKSKWRVEPGRSRGSAGSASGTHKVSIRILFSFGEPWVWTRVNPFLASPSFCKCLHLVILFDPIKDREISVIVWFVQSM